MKSKFGFFTLGVCCVILVGAGVVKTAFQSDGVVLSRIGFQCQSNTLSSIPTTLSKGDAYLWSSNGILYSINSSPSGVLTTNKLAP